MATVLAQAAYQGTIYSDALAWPASSNSVTASVLMSAADAANSSTQLSDLAIEVSHDGGLNYTTAADSGSWQGGQLDPSGNPAPPPSIGLALGTPPDHVRLRLSLPQLLSVGASLTFA